MPSKNKGNRSSTKPDNKRKKTDTSDVSNSDLSNFSRLIDSIGNDESLTEQAVDLLISNESFRNVISGKFNSVIDELKSEISDLKKRMDDMEQYSRRTCLKISGIRESGKIENTDQLALKVINELVLPNTGRNLTLGNIGRTHRIGKPSNQSSMNDRRPRDIIVRFLSYRDRALVYTNKRNLKTHNSDPNNHYKIYINEALTQQRAKLYKQTRDLFKDKKIASCWTSDGKILVKSHDDRTVNIQNETDLEQFLKIRVNTNINNGSSQPNRRKARSSSRLNISAATFVPHADLPVTSTPVSSQSVQKTQGSSNPR